MYLYILPNHLISPKNIGPYMTSFTLTLDRHVAADVRSLRWHKSNASTYIGSIETQLGAVIVENPSKDSNDVTIQQP